MVAKADMAQLSTQSHQNYKENVEHPSLRTIRVEWKSDDYRIEDPHPPRLVGKVQMQNGLVPHRPVVDKISEGLSQKPEVPDPHQEEPTHGLTYSASLPLSSSTRVAV